MELQDLLKRYPFIMRVLASFLAVDTLGKLDIMNYASMAASAFPQFSAEDLARVDMQTVEAIVNMAGNYASIVSAVMM